MPSQRVDYGGPTVVAGTFRGDDEPATIITRTEEVHVGVPAAPAVVLDGSNVDGTIVINYDHTHQDILRAVDQQDGTTVKFK